MSRDDSSLSHSEAFNKKILPWLICFIGAVFYCYEFFLRVAPNTMAIDMMAFYKIGAREFGLLTAFYMYSYTPMQIIVGLLMDHYGPRRLLSLSILCCVSGCYLISVFSELYLGKLGFFMMGFGSAFAFVGVLKLAVNWLPPNKLSLVSGITTTLGLLGGIFAETILDGFLSIVSWREAWYYAGLLGLVIFVITVSVVRDHPTKKLPKVEDMPNVSWRNLFYDLVDILKNYKFILNGLIGAILFLPISVFANTWANIFFQQAGNLSHQVVASYLVPAVFFGMAIGGPIVGIISEYIGRRKIIYQISIIVSALLFTTIIFNPTLPVQTLGILLFSLGLFCSGQILVFVIGIELSVKEASGTASACTNFIVMLGPFLFIPLIGWLIEYDWDGTLQNGAPLYSQINYLNAMLVMPACYIVAFIASLLLPDTHPKAQARALANQEKLITLTE
jgi:MFS family permease